MTAKFWSTRGEYGDFSNFSDHGFVLDGYKWKTVEHFYQAAKFPPGGENYMKVQRAKTAKEAKALGRSLDKLPAHWESRKVQVMMRALEAKFTQNEGLMELLLSTENETIVEDSPVDYEWGGGKDGTGKNLLGKCLMDLRETLRSSKKEY